ncbi:hypothetical protein QYF36_026141 [Acer negundo]|nr:hypothetical protein QYF36_026141 [Acer negundo]
MASSSSSSSQFLLTSSIAKASVPLSISYIYVYVNEGEFRDYVVEYRADYRRIRQISNSPFQLGFYNTTPNAYTLDLRMGTTKIRFFRWGKFVWQILDYPTDTLLVGQALRSVGGSVTKLVRKKMWAAV